MRVAVISCWKYADAQEPFFALFEKFWPNCPYTTELVSDIESQPLPWCRVVETLVVQEKESILLLQEDFFFNAPVNQNLIERGLEQMKARNAGCVRLYPCPGGIDDYGDPHFAIVPRGTRYRISCQAAIWNPSYLYKIASRFNTPQEFELQGTVLSNDLPEEVLAFKRDVQPWPLSYECTAIVRGKWTQGAKKLCDEHQIVVDWSRRGFQAA